MPPGSGKTVIGLEIARRIGRPTLVLAPTTTIVGQWLGRVVRVRAARRRMPPRTPTCRAGQRAHVPGDRGRRPRGRRRAGPPPTTTRAARRRLVVRGGDREAVLGLLHANGRRIVDRLASGGPVTLILDECHHLLDLWGHVLDAVVTGLPPGSHVVGLTATPPADLGRREAALYRRLFGGHADFEIVTPAVVKDGHLAPYAELALLVPPTAREEAWIAKRAGPLRPAARGPARPGVRHGPVRRLVRDPGPPARDRRRRAGRVVDAGARRPGPGPGRAPPAVGDGRAAARRRAPARGAPPRARRRGLDRAPGRLRPRRPRPVDRAGRRDRPGPGAPRAARRRVRGHAARDPARDLGGRPGARRVGGQGGRHGPDPGRRVGRARRRPARRRAVRLRVGRGDGPRLGRGRPGPARRQRRGCAPGPAGGSRRRPPGPGARHRADGRLLALDGGRAARLGTRRDPELGPAFDGPASASPSGDDRRATPGSTGATSWSSTRATRAGPRAAGCRW